MTKSSLTDASDAELVIAAAAGDEAAFGALYERHVDVAWRVAQATTGRTEDAQDATSEAFSRVYAAVIGGSFDTTKAFRPYLLTAVRNAAISAHRRSGRVELSDEVEPEGAERDRGLPEERLTAGLDASYVVDAFDRLPERARTVLWLTEVEGLAPREAAEVIGLSANTTAQLAVRARSRLRQEYLQVHLGATVDEDCRWAVEHLGAYVAGTLAKTNAARVVAHVGGCESCSARVEELDDLRAKLRFAALPLLPLLRAELAKRWRGRLISSSTPSGGVGQAATSALRSAGLKVLAGAAAVGLVVGGITWQVARDHGEPTRPIETAAASATTVASVAETTTTVAVQATTTVAPPVTTTTMTTLPQDVGLRTLSLSSEGGEFMAVHHSGPTEFSWWQYPREIRGQIWDFSGLTWTGWGTNVATARGHYEVCGEGTECPADQGSVEVRLSEPRPLQCNGDPPGMRYYSRITVLSTTRDGAGDLAPAC